MELKSDNSLRCYDIADPLADIILRTPTFTLYRAIYAMNQEERLLLIANDPHQNEVVTDFSNGIKKLHGRYGWSDRKMPLRCDSSDDSDKALDAACRCGVSFPCVAATFTTSHSQGNRAALSCAVHAPLNNLFPLVSLYNYCTISSATTIHLFYDYLLILDQLQRAGMTRLIPVDINLFFVDTYNCHLLYLGLGNEDARGGGANDDTRKNEDLAMDIVGSIISGARWFYGWSDFDGDFIDANEESCDLLDEMAHCDCQDANLTLPWAISTTENLMTEHFSWDFKSRRFDYCPYGKNGLYKAPELTLAHYYGLGEQEAELPF